MFVGLRNMLLLSACLVFATGQAWAVGLGKIEVTSHLGETFFAEAPLQLDAGEKISDVSIELAAPSDYQILEVFRDAALNNLNVDIKNDLRGPRAVVSSTEAVDTPYFNLVLKLKHGHATNFKKYPVFLDLPEQVRPAAPEPRAVEQAIAPPDQMQAEGGRPSVSAVSIRPLQEVAPSAEQAAEFEPSTEPEQTAEPTGSEFNPYEGWARSSRYGPMVRGDSITTVARRLPVDERYTLSQIMVGLYNKNKEKFRENNINLINAGTYLEVPTADEVEAIREREARGVLKEHEQRWKDLKNQPVYAAEAEAQKNRYRTRVHVGQTASGAATAPVQSGQTQAEVAGQAQHMQQGEVVVQGSAGQLRALQEENLRLKQALQESEARVDSAQPATADAAVAEQQVKKLELTVARLQRQLKQVNQDLQDVKSQDMNALTYALSGIIVLLIAVAGYLLFLLRRDRPHPAMVTSAAQPEVTTSPEAQAATDMDAGKGDSTPEGTGEADMDNAAFAESLDADLESGDVAQVDDALLFENEAPAAQAGVDYLAEADVYLRYGMEDEALQQLKLAIEQKPDHLEVHSKLVQLLQGRGDQAALAVAVETARSVLGADDLQAFEDSLSSTGGDAAPSDEVVDAAEEPSLEDDGLIMDTMPDMHVAEDDVTEVAEAGAEMDAGEQAEEVAAGSSDQFAGLDLDLSGIDVPDLDAAPGEPVDLSAEPPVLEKAVDDVASDQAEKGEGFSADEEDFVSSIEISALDGQDDVTQVASADDEGLDFTLGGSESPDADLADALGALATDDEQSIDDGIAFESSGESVDENAENISEAAIDASTDDDELGLEAILGELETDAGSSVDFVTAADAVSPLQQDTAEDAVPETVIETGVDDDLGLDEILGEFASDEAMDASIEDAAGGIEGKDESMPETVIDTVSAGDDLGLDEILGELDSFAEPPGADTGAAGGDASDSSDIAAMPEMDVSDELDGLLAEWGEGNGDIALDTGPQSLDVDRARSLLAEGSLDEAETALQTALGGDRRGDALIGLAELAAKRGDDARKNELLGEAETLVDDNNRDWFDSVKNLSA